MISNLNKRNSMIISFEIELELEDKTKTLPIIWDKPNSPVKKPLYHRTVSQLYDFSDVITGIIIPSTIPAQIEYKLDHMLDHIRLLDNDMLNKVPIGVVDCTDDSALEQLYRHAECVDFFEDRNIEMFKQKLLDNITLERLIDVIGNEKPHSEHHGLANEWGQYRLLSQLNLNNEFDEELYEIKQVLSETRYYKKLLLNEKKQKPGIDSQNKKRFKTILDNLKAKKIKIAVIDDKVHNGWDKAYSSMFTNSVVDCFDQNKKEFDAKKSSKYDLIILDLRLEETPVHDNTEIFGIEEMSGIQLLKKIKSVDPSIPVIMCTASNKSWSYDAAIHSGADGFWTKESPDFGMSLDYQFYNTLDLLNTVKNILEWSEKVRPLYKEMTKIYDHVFTHNPIIASSIDNKRNMVFSQLHSQRSKFIEKKYGSSGLVTAYLAICSLVNEAVSFYRKLIEGKFYVIINDNQYEFCEEISKKNQPPQFIISDSAIDLIKNRSYNPKKANFLFPEKQFMNFLLVKLNLGKLRKKYGFLSKIRNHLDIIHSKPIKEEFDPTTGNHTGADLPELKFDHLYEMLEIYVKVFKTL